MTTINTPQAIQQYQSLMLPGVSRIEPGHGGLPKLVIDHAGAHAEIYFHGAHVAAFSPPGGKELLFLSQASYYADAKPIRGGVPLIFPWFGPNTTDPKLPAHGFARTRSWGLNSVKLDGGSVRAEFALTDSAETRALWPNPFALIFVVKVGRQLEMALTVRNTGTTPFRFEEAMHTYFAVTDARELKIVGLAQRDYLDKVRSGGRFKQGNEPIEITAETDRVYLDSPDTVRVIEKSGREITIAKSNSLATVVWNPWIAKAKAMADFGDEEWPQMLCIETANAADHAINLSPGGEHTMTAVISQP